MELLWCQAQYIHQVYHGVEKYLTVQGISSHFRFKWAGAQLLLNMSSKDADDGSKGVLLITPWHCGDPGADD